MKKILNSKILGVLAVSLSAILWGFDGIALTPNLFNLDVPYVVFMLHAIPAVLLSLFFAESWKKVATFSISELSSLLVVALFGGALGTIAIVKALFLVRFDHLSIIVILQKLQPIFAILLARIFLKEKTSKKFWVWALIAIIAGYFLTFETNLPTISTDSNMIHASLYALLAALSFGAGTVFSKKVLLFTNYKEATYFRYTFTAILMGIYVAITGRFGHLAVTTQINWMYLLVISLTTGSGAIFLYYYGLKRVKAIVATFAELLFPISSIVFDYLINGNRLSTIQIISASIMIASIMMISKKRK